MIDLNKTIADLLKPVAHVELAFPNSKSEFPMISLLEIGNKSSVVLDGCERISDISFQIDVWDRNAENTEQLAIKVNKIMLSSGFTRTSGGRLQEKDLYRKSLRYGAKIDEISKRIYSL